MAASITAWQSVLASRTVRRVGIVVGLGAAAWLISMAASSSHAQAAPAQKPALAAPAHKTLSPVNAPTPAAGGGVHITIKAGAPTTPASAPAVHAPAVGATSVSVSAPAAKVGLVLSARGAQVSINTAPVASVVAPVTRVAATVPVIGQPAAGVVNTVAGVADAATAHVSLPSVNVRTPAGSIVLPGVSPAAGGISLSIPALTTPALTGPHGLVANATSAATHAVVAGNAVAFGYAHEVMVGPVLTPRTAVAATSVTSAAGILVLALGALRPGGGPAPVAPLAPTPPAPAPSVSSASSTSMHLIAVFSATKSGLRALAVARPGDIALRPNPAYLPEIFPG